MQNNMQPDAIAQISGDAQHPDLRGMVRLYQLPQGVLVQTVVNGLPNDPKPCAANIYAMHIHETGSCTGSVNQPFADTGGHYNPEHCPHPAHAGDLPPLFGNNGYAWEVVFTDRFRVGEVIGRSVIIHANPDDFMTQPSGNSGARIGCGVIKAVK